MSLVGEGDLLLLFLLLLVVNDDDDDDVDIAEEVGRAPVLFLPERGDGCVGAARGNERE